MFHEAEAYRISGERVRQIDPRDVGTDVNLGQVYLQQRRYADAIALFRAALAEEPYNVTAAHDLALALSRSGQANFKTRIVGSSLPPIGR
jgi:cytochrome c-type biogenesis protein CcmH/NrfG